ncbi:hypothetical protein [Azospirillum sp.]|uniref:hypothetical protein n=1 Tax=Azospirillum sp. TaxID=34012 RepID=UPI0026243C3D|nr:hypothetical protein [Azospirillum sp.]
MSNPPKRFAPPPTRWPVSGAGATVQRMATFTPLRAGKSERASAGDELVRSQGDEFLLSSAERNLRTRPNGTYNFVRVQGATRNDQHTYVSARSGHAGLAAGRPVLYAGTLRFDGGKLDWWSNYSGTYQPMAAFRQQAQLPDERFIPWQKLQMGGVGLQRGMFSDQRAAVAPDKPQATRLQPPKPPASAAASNPASNSAAPGDGGLGKGAPSPPASAVKPAAPSANPPRAAAAAPARPSSSDAASPAAAKGR